MLKEKLDKKVINKHGSFMVVILLFCVMLVTYYYGQEIKVQAADNQGKNSVGTPEPVKKVNQFKIDTKTQIRATYHPYMDFDYSQLNKINTFWGGEGNYHLAYSNDKTVFISIVDKNMKLIKTLEIKKEMKYVGNITQDKQGNYYIVYGQNDMTGDQYSTSVVMNFIQYDKNGKKLKELKITGQETIQETTGNSSGTMEPFAVANCELLIDNEGILVCFYGRGMYNGHQSSNVIYIDTNTMKRAWIPSHYVSHSYNQKVIQANNGDYIFAERGDAFERGINITRITKKRKDENYGESFVPFHFRRGIEYQSTYATIAGIAELSNGYVLVGTSEKILTHETAKDYEFNESRNVFMQVFSKDFTENSTNDPSVQLLSGTTRKVEGTYTPGGYMKEGSVDYGVLWLTNYTGNDYASSPKMIALDEEKVLIMWEKKEYKMDSSSYIYDSTYYSWNEDRGKFDFSDHFLGSYYMVVAKDGSIVIPETSLGEVRIPEFGDISLKDGSVYWCTSDGEEQKITIYQLEVGKASRNVVRVTGIETKEKEVNIYMDEKKKLEVTLYPSNATNQELIYGYDSDLLSIDKDGVITVKRVTNSEIIITSKENHRLYTKVRIHGIQKAPTKVKAVQGNYYGDYSITLSWNEVGKDNEYNIFRSTSKNEEWDWIATTSGKSYIDDTVSKNTTYYYKIRVSDDYVVENYNPFSTIVMIYVVEEPSNIKLAKKSKTSATISWKSNKKVDGYEIYYYNSKTKKYVLDQTITKNTTLTYTKTKLAKGKTHYFKVRNYKTLDGKTYYSPYSETIKIKM